MPNVAGREFPYTPQGMAAAEQYKQSLGMRNGGTAGFRPLGYRDGGDVEAANDATYSKLQTALDTLKDKEQLNNFIHENKAALESMAEASSARRETLESIKHFSNFAGFMERIMQEGEGTEELGTGIPQEMYRPGLGDYVEQFLPPEMYRPGLGDDVEQFFPEANREVLEQMPEFQTNGFYKAEPYRFPINPDTGLPWTDEERGPSRRVPKSGGVNPETGEGYPGIGYHTGDNTGNITSTMEYVPARDMPQDPILKLLRERNEGRGMRNGGMMGFRPVGYQDGDLVEDPYAPSLYQGGIDSSEFLPGGPITPLVATGMGRKIATRMAEGAPGGGDGGMSKAVDAVSSLVQEFMAQGVPDIAKKVTNAAVATFGLPVDLVNSILESLGVPVSDTPIGGSRNLIETFGFPGDQEATQFGQTEIPGVAGSINPLVATGAGARVARETLQGAGTAVPYGMRHGGIMSLRRR